MSDTDTDDTQITKVVRPAVRRLAKPEWEERGAYCCAMCGNKVTTSENAVVRQGNHFHDRVNPDGRRFLIVCFAAAEGCNCSGKLTADYSWFEGYRWHFAHCQACGSQLGWRFVGVDSFFGLILEQLVECPAD